MKLKATKKSKLDALYQNEFDAETKRIDQKFNQFKLRNQSLTESKINADFSTILHNDYISKYIYRKEINRNSHYSFENPLLKMLIDKFEYLPNEFKVDPITSYFNYPNGFKYELDVAKQIISIHDKEYKKNIPSLNLITKPEINKIVVIMAQILANREYINKYLKSSNLNVQNTDTNHSLKFNWKGTQKELAELFIELENKGWIETANIKAIKASFTKSKTIEQLIKKGSKPYYSEVYTKSYRPKFDSIREIKKN